MAGRNLLMDMMNQPSTANVLANYREPQAYEVGRHSLLPLVEYSDGSFQAGLPGVINSALTGLLSTDPEQFATQYPGDEQAAIDKGNAAIGFDGAVPLMGGGAVATASGATQGGLGIFGGFFGKKPPQAPATSQADLVKFVESQFPRGDGRRPPMPMRSDGSVIDGSEFTHDQIKAEFDRQAQMRSFERAYAEQPTPRRAPRPIDPDYMTSADRDAVMARQSEVNRLNALARIGPDPEMPPQAVQPPIVEQPPAMPPAQAPDIPADVARNVGSDPSPVRQGQSRGPSYTNAHSQASEQFFNEALKEIGPRLQEIGNADMPAVREALKKGLAERGLPVPSDNVLDRRIRQSLGILGDMQGRGMDITDPGISRLAFGRRGTLAIPGAVAGGAAMSEFDQLLNEYAQTVRDMDGDGVITENDILLMQQQGM